MRVLLACDRSAGHIWPALALARALREKGDCVYFFTSSEYFQGYLHEHDHNVMGRPLPVRNLFIEGLYRFWEALFILCRLQPKKIIGFGGRDSFFLLLWGRLLFKHTALYEPNRSMGRANRLIVCLVDELYCGFQEMTSRYPHARSVGIPVKESLRKIKSNQARAQLGFDQDVPVVFVMGGSQGSSFLNQVMVEFLSRTEQDVQVIHLTGRKDFQKMSEFYSTIERKSFVRDFWEEVGLLYSAADIIISRAGAMTLGEVVYFQIPAVVVPYPYASGHQMVNAQYFQERDCLRIFPQREFSHEHFQKTVEKLLRDVALRRTLRENLRRIDIAVGSDEFCKSILS